MAIELPNVNQPFVNPETGEVNRVWYLALLGLNSAIPANVVTSVNISGLNGITVVGAPITSAGVITLGIGNLTCANALIAGTVTAANMVVTSVFTAANITTPGTVTAANVIATASVNAANMAATGTVTSARHVNTLNITSSSVIITSTTTPQGLVDISGASAGQIQFPAAQNASTGANTLDDYEEGTWVPTDGSGAGLAFTVTSATYTKVGRMVIAQADITYPVTASGAGAVIGNLPFTIANDGACAIANQSAAVGVEGKLIGGTATVALFASGAASTNVQNSGGYVKFCAVYQV